jgi:hypothetical protein
MSEVTEILRQIRDGNQQSAEQLLTLVYTELKRIAAQKMAGEAPGHTLQPTALVHEAWIKLVGEGGAHFENRAHFFSAAAEGMRRILALPPGIVGVWRVVPGRQALRVAGTKETWRESGLRCMPLHSGHPGGGLTA